MYALTFMINYTGARTLSRVYHYNALMIGVITITYGLGMSCFYLAVLLN